VSFCLTFVHSCYYYRERTIMKTESMKMSGRKFGWGRSVTWRRSFLLLSLNYMKKLQKWAFMLFNGDYYLVGYHDFYLVVSSLGRVQLVRSIILLKSMHELVTKKIGYGLSNRRTLVAYNRSRYIHVPICIRSRHLRNLYPRWPYCSLINGYHRRLLPTIYYTYYSV
jgi:hypothetical protein